MPDLKDVDLLQQYAARNSEPAFAELVQRHINLVYSVALRYVGNAQDAQDVTQAVFVILAQKAADLRQRTALTGWLYETTRFTAIRFLRTRARQRARDQEAYVQSTLNDSDSEHVWRQLAPLLEDAMARLNEKERALLALRFYENRSGGEAAGLLGISEWASRKRAARALKKLQQFFHRHGVTSTTEAIAGAISAHAMQAAPVTLAKSVTAVAMVKGATAGASTLFLIQEALKFMAWTKAKTAILVSVGLMLTAGTTALVIHAVYQAQSSTYNAPRAASLFKPFVAEKKAQAVAAAAAEGKRMSSGYDAFFAAAEKGDLPALRQVASTLRQQAPLTETSFAAVEQTAYAFEMFSQWDEKYALAYAQGIAESIPPGSIYLTGVPMGAYILPALQKSDPAAGPIFAINQGELVEESYRTYLRHMYGDQLHVPTEEAVQKCFQDYAPDAWLRQQQGKLVRDDYQRIARLIAQAVFDENPDREFYDEESWPVDWMYPHLEPHGLILKISRQPLSELSAETVMQDHDFWVHQLQPMIGNWLTADTPVKELVAWTDRVQLKHDFHGFTGDRRFIKNTRGERQIFSNLRNAIGGVYAWRAGHAADPAERERMTREADFAFRQALALWPCSPASSSPVGRYMDLLKQENRLDDARLIQKMAQRCAAQLKR
jgi:RNA polymerase sigma factor (sigma-70 family)